MTVDAIRYRKQLDIWYVPITQAAKKAFSHYFASRRTGHIGFLTKEDLWDHSVLGTEHLHIVNLTQDDATAPHDPVCNADPKTPRYWGEGCNCRGRKEREMATPYNADAVDLSQFLRGVKQHGFQQALAASQEQQTFAAQREGLRAQMDRVAYVSGIDPAIPKIVDGKITRIDWVGDRVSGDEGVGLVPMSKDPLGRLAKPIRVVPSMPANALAWTGCGAAPMIEFDSE